MSRPNTSRTATKFNANPRNNSIAFQMRELMGPGLQVATSLDRGFRRSARHSL